MPLKILATVLFLSFSCLGLMANGEPASSEVLVFENGAMKNELSTNLYGVVDYHQQYPNGDFYFLTGDLDSERWRASDFSKFYTNAKWLSQRGFRVIVNPYSYIRNVREAVQNPNTSAIVWNGHAYETGGVTDATEATLPSRIFNERRSPRLRYVFFATCMGKTQVTYYNIHPPVTGWGFPGDLTSNQFFRYFNSAQSVADLEKSMGKRLPVLSK